ncbi:MAG TPA: bifunctional copper resistance protein CopD/cytochrome c oxidase assembly protein, partial [Actinomycetales bacterium]|nr:bifunctional copper resistance protein CopD/cytochrome c oxidase assembly protein [Actinomycetales bacterium]
SPVPGGRSRQAEETPSEAWRLAVRIGQGAAIVWVLAQIAYIVLTYAQVWGRALTEPTFGDELTFFITRTDLGQTVVAELVLAVVVSVLAVSTAGMVGAVWTAAMGAIALAPVALTGHAAGSAHHHLALSAMWLHLVPLALWLGGLAVLVAVFAKLGPELEKAAGRYSQIALWCFVLVGMSGVFSSVIRLNGPADLVVTPWGRLLLLKIALWALLGWMGWEHRRRTIPQLGSRPGLFWRFAAVEVAVMGAIMGVAVALGSSAPPVPQEPVVDPSAVFRYTHYPEPPLPTVSRWFTEWHWDPLYLAAAISAVVVYLVWVRRLKARGDSWPVGRTVMWVSAWVFFVWIVCGGPYVYGVVLFSAHMIMHMLLVMTFPILLVLAAPITLLLRAVPARRDGSRGPREWTLALLHSPWAQAWASPWVAGVNFVGSLFVFYYTDLLSLALRYHVGHVLMIVHFTLAGYLFMNAVIGIDPGTRRPGHAVRLIMLFAVMIFHAFFGLSLANMTSLLAADFYGRLGLTWWVDALYDQQIGGFITWGIGEMPTLILAIVLAVEWSRADEKDAKRIDRRADRDHDAELEAYNRMLAARAAAMEAHREAR